MRRIFFVLFLIAPLHAQLLVDTFAGGRIPPGALGAIISGTTNDTGGATWDGSGNVIFCDTTYNVIRRLRADGSLETIGGTGVYGFSGDGGPAVSALLNSPRTPRYDKAGNLYFFDSLNARLRRIDSHGVIQTIAGDGESYNQGFPPDGPALSRPLGNISDLVADASGNVYFSTMSQIFRVTPAGQVQNLGIHTVAAGNLALDDGGNLYFFDGQDFQVPQHLLRMSPTGIISTFAALTVTLRPGSPPPGTYLKSSLTGVIYAGIGDQAYRFAADGTASAVAKPADVPFPSSIDAQGNMIFVGSITPDAYVQIPVIQEWTAQGELKTIAGANPKAVPDGTALRDAWLLNPSSIAFSRTGDLYVAEFGACLIRKISVSGVLSTFAGTGKCGYPAPTGNAKTADLVYPSSIAVDSQDRVWVADYFLNLYSISQDGTLSAMLKTPVAGGKGKLAVDSKDRVYVLGTFSLYRVLADGTNQTIVGPPEGAGIPPPGTITDLTAIGTDRSGSVYFQAGYDNYVVNDDGTFTSKSSNSPSGANSLAVDVQGRIWQSESVDFLISNPGPATTHALLGNRRIGTSGDGGSAQAAGYSTASSAQISPGGDLYFLDSNRIRRFSGSGPETPPVISQNGIVNGASYVGGPIAPGELISIFGSNFGVSSLRVSTAVNNAIPSTLGRTRVLFNNFPGAITAVTPNQINVFVPPYGTDYGNTVNVAVQVDDVLSAVVTMPLLDAAPGLSTADGSGSGPGAILNQDGSVNSAANPAARGSIVSLFGTGTGLTTPSLGLGFLAISPPYPLAVSAVSVTIGGQKADVLYAGDAPLFPTGVFQINTSVPTNINPGPAAVSVMAGGSATSRLVTVAVK